MRELKLNLPCPALPRLPPRQNDGHKGTYGNALLIGGSRGMAGAIALAGHAAARTGAGLVRIAVPDCCLETVAGFSPCAMTVPLPHDDRGRISDSSSSLNRMIEKATCIAIGPGLGRSVQLQQFVSMIIASTTCPIVVDADGINNLSDGKLEWAASDRLVFTPHPGEWSRLSGVAANSRLEQVTSAVDLAKQSGYVVVLKGHRTLITDGKSAVFNNSGTPAMATGGSGDVLTGVITALICQGLSPRDAAHLGVFAHGLAGEFAQRAQQSHVVLPTELIGFLPTAFRYAR